MKLIIALLLLAGTSSFLHWYSPVNDKSWLGKSNLRLSAKKKVDKEALHDGMLAKLREEFFPDPAVQLKSSGPRELLLSTLGADKESSVTITEDMVGTFFYKLFREQSVFDIAYAVSGAGDNTIEKYANDAAGEDVGQLELKLADLVQERVDEPWLIREHNKRTLARYIKVRVVPMWFSAYREELCDMLGLSELDEEQTKD